MLKEDHLLQGLDRETFVERISVHYDNFNILHPFREGNGRAQRLFWNLVAHDAGWRLNWHMVSKQENDRASQIAKETADESSLVAMFTRIVQTPYEFEVSATKHVDTHLQDDGYATLPNTSYRLSAAELSVERERNIYRRMTGE